MSNSPNLGSYGRVDAPPRPHGLSQSQIDDENARFMARVYRWMAAGLGITAAVSLVVTSSPTLLMFFLGNPLVFFGLIIAELVMVWKFASVARNASASTAAVLFLTYSAVSGITFSAILLRYTAQSVGQVFITTMVMFGVMSIYGTVTKKDLSSVGSFCIMGLMGLVITSLVNLFLQSSAVSWMMGAIGVVVFTGLTAYDTQKIKELNVIGNEGSEDDTKEALNGALVLYLDFVNLFISLLRLMGNRR